MEGNSDTTSIQVTYSAADTTDPSIGIDSPVNGANLTANPVTVTGAVSDDVTVASVTVNGVAASINGNSYSADIPLDEGVNTITAQATDSSSNTASASIDVTYDPPDLTAPTVAIQGPSDGEVLTNDRVTVTGTVSDDPGLDTVDVNGIDAVLSNGTFIAMDVPLTEGPNRLTATATDAAGNIGADAISVVYSMPPRLSIATPTDGALVSGDLLDVSGTIDDENATVTVNGIAAVVTGGAFAAVDVPVDEGYNRLTATATNQAGVTGSDRIQVRRDTTRPMVTIETPQDGAVLTSLQVDVAGLVNDQSTNLNIDEQDVTVTVNGVPAMISQRAWVIPDMLLQRGPNTLDVVATDTAGNSRGTAIQVDVQDLAGQRIVMLAGNAQYAEIGTQLPDPLVVTLLDANGDPVPGKPVHFAVSRGEGRINTASGDAIEATVLTDDNGLASVFFTLGNRAGAGNHRVLATASGFLGQVEYCLVAMAASPRRITSVTGDQQVGIVGRTLGMPLKVLVNDAGGNPAEGVEVTFEVTRGSGTIDGAATAARTTDNDGYASIDFTLGEQEGINNQVVTARFPDLPESPATFSASARVPTQQTSFSGLVIDNQDNPVEGVTVRIVQDRQPQDPALETATDDQGRFLLEDVPTGPVALIVDGATALRPGSWIRLTFELDVIAGIQNSIGMPIYLLPVGPNATVVQNGGPEQDILLTMPEIPGAEVIVKAHSVTCPPNLSECVVSWTQINAERMAMPPPMGSVVMLGWTLQPTGAKFDPPVDICIPNMDMPPGMQVEMFNWDYGLLDWAAVGTATITADGSQLCSDPGFGIPSAGWGCCVPPPPPCSSACSECGEAPECKKYVKDSTECGGCTCKLENLPDGTSCDDGNAENCVVLKCKGGGCVDEPNDGEDPGICKKCESGQSVNDDEDKPDEQCKDCSGGQEVNIANGSKSRDDMSCCFEGEEVLMFNVPYEDLIAKRPSRRQVDETVRRHEIDGCSNSPDNLESWDNNPFATNYDLYVTNPIWGTVLGAISNAVSAIQTLPCNVHDICYQTCGSNQAGCDNALGAGITASCDIGYPFPCPHATAAQCTEYDAEYQSCRGIGPIYRDGVQQFGGGAYQDRQSQYCGCCSNS